MHWSNGSGKRQLRQGRVEALPFGLERKRKQKERPHAGFHAADVLSKYGKSDLFITNHIPISIQAADKYPGFS